MNSLVMSLESNYENTNLILLGLKPITVDFINLCKSDPSYLEVPFIQVIESLKNGDKVIKSGVFKGCEISALKDFDFLVENPEISIKYKIV